MNSDHDVRELLERMAHEPAIGPVDPEPMVRRAHRRLARTAVLGFACVALLAGVAIGGANLVLSSPTVPATPNGDLPPILRDGEVLIQNFGSGQLEALDPSTGDRRTILDCEAVAIRAEDAMWPHLRLRDIRRWPMARLLPQLWWFLPARDRDLGDERTRGQAPTDGRWQWRAVGLVATGLHARDLRGRRGVRAGHDRPADGGSNDGREPERRGRGPGLVTRRNRDRLRAAAQGAGSSRWISRAARSPSWRTSAAAPSPGRPTGRRSRSTTTAVGGAGSSS